jgi:hypothetical protein
MQVRKIGQQLVNALRRCIDLHFKLDDIVVPFVPDLGVDDVTGQQVAMPAPEQDHPADGVSPGLI